VLFISMFLSRKTHPMKIRLRRHVSRLLLRRRTSILTPNPPRRLPRFPRRHRQTHDLRLRPQRQRHILDQLASDISGARLASGWTKGCGERVYIHRDEGRVEFVAAAGTLLVRVQSNSTVKNFAWTGPKLRMHWTVGGGGIARMEWGLQGQELR